MGVQACVKKVLALALNPEYVCRLVLCATWLRQVASSDRSFRFSEFLVRNLL